MQGWVCPQCGQSFTQAGHICQSSFQNPYQNPILPERGMIEPSYVYQIRCEINSLHEKLNRIIKMLEDK